MKLTVFTSLTLILPLVSCIPAENQRSSSGSASCGLVGYDKGNPTAYYFSDRDGSLAACASRCAGASKCQGYAFGSGSCLLYKAPVSGNVKLSKGSPYQFFDKSCSQSSSPSQGSSPTSRSPNNPGSSGSPLPEGDLICGHAGWDKGNPEAFYSSSKKANAKLAGCKALCTKKKCLSFAIGDGECLLYKASVATNVKASSGSPYRFYDAGCSAGDIGASSSISRLYSSSAPSAGASSSIEASSAASYSVEVSSSVDVSPSPSVGLSASSSAEITPSQTGLTLSASDSVSVGPSATGGASSSLLDSVYSVTTRGATESASASVPNTAQSVNPSGTASTSISAFASTTSSAPDSLSNSASRSSSGSSASIFSEHSSISQSVSSLPVAGSASISVSSGSLSSYLSTPSASGNPVSSTSVSSDTISSGVHSAATGSVASSGSISASLYTALPSSSSGFSTVIASQITSSAEQSASTNSALSVTYVTSLTSGALGSSSASRASSTVVISSSTVSSISSSSASVRPNVITLTYSQSNVVNSDNVEYATDPNTGKTVITFTPTSSNPSASITVRLPVDLQTVGVDGNPLYFTFENYLLVISVTTRKRAGAFSCVFEVLINNSLIFSIDPASIDINFLYNFVSLVFFLSLTGNTVTQRVVCVPGPLPVIQAGGGAIAPGTAPLLSSSSSWLSTASSSLTVFYPTTVSSASTSEIISSSVLPTSSVLSISSSVGSSQSSYASEMSSSPSTSTVYIPTSSASANPSSTSAVWSSDISYSTIASAMPSPSSSVCYKPAEFTPLYGNWAGQNPGALGGSIAGGSIQTNINIPFSVCLAGNCGTSLDVGTNGAVYYRGSRSDGGLFLKVFFTNDLYYYAGQAHGVYSRVYGPIGERRFEIAWYAATASNSAAKIHFTVTFFEGTPDTIQYDYYDVSTLPGSTAVAVLNGCFTEMTIRDTTKGFSTTISGGETHRFVTPSTWCSTGSPSYAFSNFDILTSCTNAGWHSCTEFSADCPVPSSTSVSSAAPTSTATTCNPSAPPLTDSDMVPIWGTWDGDKPGILTDNSVVGNPNLQTSFTMPLNICFAGTCGNKMDVGVHGIAFFRGSRTDGGSVLKVFYHDYLTLNLNQRHGVFYSVSGSTGSRKFVLHWFIGTNLSNNDGIYMTMTMYEGQANVVEYRYLDFMSSHSGNIGIQQDCFNIPYTVDSFASAGSLYSFQVPNSLCASSPVTAGWTTFNTQCCIKGGWHVCASD